MEPLSLDEIKKDAIKLSKNYYSLAKSISPFSLPIELVDGDAMTGEIRKPLIVISNEDYVNNTLSSEKRIIPFFKVLMGRDLTKLSSATYIHELAHAEQESVPGYTDSILNKEVISIFLEKIAALELDPTGELLKISERRRFADLLDTFRLLKLNEFTHTLSPEELLNNSIYIHSTLLAEKLFDLYLEERKQKKRDKYIYNIQDVFDGKIQIEELLARHDVTIQKGKDLNLVKKHI